MATTIPRTPMETNIQRQPKEIIRTVSSGGAMVGPSEEAQFQIPVGNPRSRTFHQSRTARAAPENIGASPAPRKTRAITLQLASWRGTDRSSRSAPAFGPWPVRLVVCTGGGWFGRELLAVRVQAVHRGTR